MSKRPTPAQIRVLEAARDGRLDTEQSFVEDFARYTIGEAYVTDTVKSLIESGHLATRSLYPRLTPAGRAALDEVRP